MNRWRSVGNTQGDSASGADGKPMLSGAGAIDSDVEMNMDGIPMADEDNEDGETILTDENIDGAPMADSSDEETEGPAPTAEDLQAAPAQPGASAPAPSRGAEQENVSKPVHVPTVSHGRRVRPKAADFDDMFE